MHTCSLHMFDGFWSADGPQYILWNFIDFAGPPTAVALSVEQQGSSSIELRAGQASS